MFDNEARLLKNLQKWEEKIIDIFPMAIPKKSEWHEDMDIINILFTLCNKNLNSIYYPDGQVLSLYGVDFAKEDKCIELITEESIDIIKPKKLLMHYYDEAYAWCYFRLEIDSLQPIYIYNEYLDKEELVSLEKGDYADIDSWSKGYYEDSNNNQIKLDDSSEVVNRYLNKSSFLIFPKESPFRYVYNRNFNTYSDKELDNIIENIVLKEERG